MMVATKYFTTHKRGECASDNQDSVFVNNTNCKYALSDGVSQSFLPRILADILTESFATLDGIFPPDNIAQLFEHRKENLFSTLDEDRLFWEQESEQYYKFSAATFVGLHIHDQQSEWTAVGDSCLLILPESGKPQCICSNPLSITDDGKINIKFNNRPSIIRSNGDIKGNIIIGRTDLISAGWYVLMSDAISKWFINRLNEGHNMAPLLFELNDNDAFDAFVDNEYKAGQLNDDDCSVILIHIDPEEPENCSEATDTNEDKNLYVSEFPANISKEEVFKSNKKKISCILRRLYLRIKQSRFIKESHEEILHP